MLEREREIRDKRVFKHASLRSVLRIQGSERGRMERHWSVSAAQCHTVVYVSSGSYCVNNRAQNRS